MEIIEAGTGIEVTVTVTVTQVMTTEVIHLPLIFKD